MLVKVTHKEIVSRRVLVLVGHSTSIPSSKRVRLEGSGKEINSHLFTLTKQMQKINKLQNLLLKFPNAFDRIG